MASLVTLLIFAVGSSRAHALGIPGVADVAIGQKSASLFVRYPDMLTCQASHYTNCYRFADETVLGQVSPLTVFIPFLDFFHAPWGDCVKVPQLGASPEVVEVYAGAGLPLVVGHGECGELMNLLNAGRAFLAVPGVRKVIPPMVATVLELDAASR